MSLYVVATPIGNYEDLSLRAIETLKSCDLVIGEEKREVELLLKRAGAFPKPYELLNEHSKPQDLEALAKECATKTVALVSDCGTPGFCDPGADLVRLCRQKKIEIKTLPGPSSLMALLSLTGHRIDEFYFMGFLPRETEARTKKLNTLTKIQVPTILMDTPYRLKKLLEEIQTLLPQKQLFLGCDFTQDSESIYEGTATQIQSQLKSEKAEFVLLILP